MSYKDLTHFSKNASIRSQLSSKYIQIYGFGVIEFILDRADADDGDPLGMLESVLYCDKHRVMI